MNAYNDNNFSQSAIANLYKTGFEIIKIIITYCSKQSDGSMEMLNHAKLML